ncbi:MULTISPECIES: DUF1890 domain-containing protein [Methanobacterium]|uniref:DUF1890 domain-containing protein n=1 Tax=Methanobacterium formicicum TaxID=2162 RepID=A0A090I8P2_METFO|nr:MULTISPECIES: DUF1890 domain-containing protein [Methanobacterium]AIS32567.1 hypothetical protein BRM9_1757 [Methanobacterium formicicum]KUK74179.1 MAG: Uncharacterized protein XD90_1377 [Methanobacterium sp. 42_16]MBF4474053.1 DUF1890 domain-containing protein [Methanobacterium formicicum]MDD4811179.1 DUF1890 domain-containing protein [Methanobacterium formicicum]MDH2659625.1 DUF1890 domain-containing protein [Methanobacterium formicicum]
MKKAIILLGCPESPSQTPLTIYAAHKLTEMGYEVTVASTPSAKKLVEVADPVEYYVQNKIDIESCLDNLEEGEFDLLLGFVAKDAAVSYFVTFYHILNTKSLALVFHRDPEKLENFENSVRENTNADIASARAYHNPTPLRVRLDRALDKLEKQGDS